ncbi:hypothetical protein K4F52_008815 [Lecanicillium sp. MT-2017a]|nr:hypothetical protein K4F52_008815 [Lecanicillium sp. MT-2017a]
MLHASGYDVDFVGPLHTGTNAGDPDNAGYFGYTILRLHDKIAAERLVAMYNPDHIFLHIGGNNMGDDDRASQAPGDLRKLLSEIFKQGPKTSVVIATLIKTATPAYNERIDVFNQQVKDIVAELKGKGEPISCIDLSDAINPDEDLADGLHPNDKGYQKMAAAWSKYLRCGMSGAGAKIRQHNPHFQTTNTVPARTSEPEYIPFWENKGIVIDFADSGTTDLYAINPLTGNDGIAATFNVTAKTDVSVTFRVRHSLFTPSCQSTTHQLHVAADVDDDKGLHINTTAGDTTWNIYQYIFKPQKNMVKISFRALGPTADLCGPCVADVIVQQYRELLQWA